MLIEYDVSCPLLSLVWIGEGDFKFWQNVIFERIPSYCTSCKHLGHTSDTCYITNPGLCKPQQGEFQGRQPREKGKLSNVDIQPRVNSPDRYFVIVDKRPQEPNFSSSSYFFIEAA